ncbi:hypothetical protein Cmaq_1101 [Caldivirga maquilingensis IC-167]|uniref:Uncharacterized protein n=2 Tax=Caldivirga maquilingensis TaxID=76887 RepID=A8MDS3_CALMQ|nr:hypothetical protein Cmaq_1101 [Caldivirga maquilingensis IC-167]
MHLILHILYRRANLCLSLGLDCMGLPVVSTSVLTMRNCDRDSVYKLIRRLLRMRNKLGKNIKLLELGDIKVYLRISKTKGSIHIYDGYMMSNRDCSRLNGCITVNNVTLLYIYLLIRLSGRNMVLINVPDALIWIAKVFGKETAVSILDLVHNYMERGELSGEVNTVLNMVNLLGLRISKEQFENALLPTKRILRIIRDA